MHQRTRRTTALVAVTLLACTAAFAGTPITPDFDALAVGTSVEGPGAVDANLEIHSATGQAVVIGTGLGPKGFEAPKASPVDNNCLATPGCFVDVTLACAYGQGFTDPSHSCDQGNQYTFTFPGLPSVESFSIRMVDFGDLNRCGGDLAIAGLYAYAADGSLVDSDELVLDTDGSTLPGAGSSSFGDLSIVGDACTALPGQPGNYTFRVTGSGITRVELAFSAAANDTYVGFGAIVFEPEDTPDVDVRFDAHPTSCPNPLNTKAKGVWPAAIVGGPLLDVTQIDPGSVRVAGLAPLRWAIEDVVSPYVGPLETCGSCTTAGADGYPDLTLKFDQQAIVAALAATYGDDLADGACLEVEATGQLKEEFGGTAFAASDVITIKMKGK